MIDAPSIVAVFEETSDRLQEAYERSLLTSDPSVFADTLTKEEGRDFLTSLERQIKETDDFDRVFELYRQFLFFEPAFEGSNATRRFTPMKLPPDHDIDLAMNFKSKNLEKIQKTKATYDWILESLEVSQFCGSGTYIDASRIVGDSLFRMVACNEEEMIYLDVVEYKVELKRMKLPPADVLDRYRDELIEKLRALRKKGVADLQAAQSWIDQNGKKS